MNIVTLRQRLGLTQVRLAELTGVHAMTVSKWERGVLRPSRHQREILTVLARGVAVPPQLFSHNDQQDQWQTLKGRAAVATGWGAPVVGGEIRDGAKNVGFSQAL